MKFLYDTALTAKANPAVFFGGVAAGTIVTQAVNLFIYGGLSQESSNGHAVTKSKTEIQEDKLTRAIATQDWGLVAEAKTMASNMIDHCMTYMNRDHNTAVALFVIAALIAFGSAVLGYKLSQAPKPEGESNKLLSSPS